MNLRVCYLCGSIQGVKKYLSTNGNTYHYCRSCAEKEASEGRLVEPPKAYTDNEATKLKGPTDWEKEPVPRKAYVELMKSCKRLNELRLAKKERVKQETYFCYECGEIVDNPASKVKILCDPCKEQGKIKQEATQREKWAECNRERKERRRERSS